RAARQGLVVRRLVRDRDRARADVHRAVHAARALRAPLARAGRERPPSPPAMARDDLILRLDGVSRSFGALNALSRVSFDVRAGEIFSVIGPNGAGKSTLFNVISGLHVASAGRIVFDGQDITGLPPDAINRRGLAKTFQITNVFPEISVRENVRVAAQSRAPESGRLPSLWRQPDVDARVMELLQGFGLD